MTQTSWIPQREKKKQVEVLATSAEKPAQRKVWVTRRRSENAFRREIQDEFVVFAFFCQTTSKKLA